jgi:serine/threonine protein kinase
MHHVAQIRKTFEELDKDKNGRIDMEDVYENRHYLHLVMEFLPGGELYDHIVKVDGYSEKKASIIIKQILSALAFMLERNIVLLG